jgi:hypothetical protein
MKRIISICLFAVYAAVITPNEGVAQSIEDEIRTDVKVKLTQWMQKGEFERMTDYRQRLKESSLIAFKQVYVSVVRNMIRVDITSKMFYDTESEMFSVYFRDRYFNERDYTYKSFIHVPFSTAQKFKERWNESDNGYFVQDLCFINGKLHFKTINRTVDEQTYSFPIQEIEYDSRIFATPKDFKGISLAFNSLDIDNEYLRDVVLMYSDIEKQIDERKNTNRFEQYQTRSDEKKVIVNNYNSFDEQYRPKHALSKRIIVFKKQEAQLAKKIKELQKSNAATSQVDELKAQLENLKAERKDLEKSYKKMKSDKY